MHCKVVLAVSGSHRTCTYPKGKRPRGVKEGAVMFMARMTRDPDDMRVYGKAEGMAHKPGRDDATPKDVELRDWKDKWPHYVRVRNPVFVAGKLANGVSLNAMMEALGADAFVSTKRNKERGSGNVEPRRAYRQQAAVELTREAAVWLNARLESSMRQNGKLTAEELDFP